MRRWWSSLTVRLVVASLAWTIGLLYVAHLVSVVVLFGGAAALNRFGHSIGLTSALAIAIMIFGAWVVRRAITSFSSLRERLLDVQDGREPLVQGRYVNEVQPVVNALNDLLQHQDRRMRDALARAGDLAHGLKTPLAVLGHEAERAAAAGHHELAETILQQIERMRRHVDYHLAHARAAASGSVPGTRCPVAESAAAIVRTLTRLHAQRGLSFNVDAPPEHAVRATREDLDEMLGNVLDNACKFARSRVHLTSTRDADQIIITIEDDGPGLPPELLDVVLKRGVRADEASPGSGLGLAITRDLVELHGGSISLDSAVLGGLRVRLRLPNAGDEHSAEVQLR